MAFKEVVELLTPYTSQILRLVMIPFSSLGVVYIIGRMLDIAKSDRSKNIIAFISILALSLLTGNFGNNPQTIMTFDYLFEAFIYMSLSVILYVTVCWRLFPRIDALLDKKIGSDTAMMEEEAKRKKAEALARKEKREIKKLQEENKKLESKTKRLSKKK